MNGKTGIVIPFATIYEMQTDFQMQVEQIELPKDNCEKFSQHISSVVEELGEVLRADKRWKTHRNKAYNRDEKLVEIADVIICAFNLGIFSGFTGQELEVALLDKIQENFNRLEKEVSK